MSERPWTWSVFDASLGIVAFGPFESKEAAQAFINQHPYGHNLSLTRAAGGHP